MEVAHRPEREMADRASAVESEGGVMPKKAPWITKDVRIVEAMGWLTGACSVVLTGFAIAAVPTGEKVPSTTALTCSRTAGALLSSCCSSLLSCWLASRFRPSFSIWSVQSIGTSLPVSRATRRMLGISQVLARWPGLSSSAAFSRCLRPLTRCPTTARR